MCVEIGITCESIQVFWLLLAREIRINTRMLSQAHSDRCRFLHISGCRFFSEEKVINAWWRTVDDRKVDWLYSMDDIWKLPADTLTSLPQVTGRTHLWSRRAFKGLGELLMISFWIYDTWRMSESFQSVRHYSNHISDGLDIS